MAGMEGSAQICISGKECSWEGRGWRLEARWRWVELVNAGAWLRTRILPCSHFCFYYGSPLGSAIEDTQPQDPRNLGAPSLSFYPNPCSCSFLPIPYETSGYIYIFLRFIYLFIYLFIYFWLSLVLVEACGLFVATHGFLSSCGMLVFSSLVEAREPSGRGSWT